MTFFIDDAVMTCCRTTRLTMTFFANMVGRKLGM